MGLQRLKESLRFWWRYLGALLLVTLPFSIAGEAVQWVLGPVVTETDAGATLNAVTLLPFLALKPLAEGALIGQLAAIQAGQPRSLAACLQFSIRVAPVLFPIYLLLALAVGMGWMLLVLPGIWIYARCCMAPLLAALENTPVGDSFRTAWQRSHTLQWELFGALCLMAVVVILGAAATTALLEALLGNTPWSRLLGSIVAGVLSALINVLVFRYYVLTRPPTLSIVPDSNHTH